MALVSDEQIIKVLRQYNSWWRIPSAIQEETKPQKRLAYYDPPFCSSVRGKACRKDNNPVSNHRKLAAGRREPEKYSLRHL